MSRALLIIPEGIVIQHTIYSVDWDDEMDDYGRVNYGQRGIILNENLHTEEAKRTFMHEILHIISEQAGHKLSEGELDALSHGLIDVIRGNDWFPDFFKEIV